MTLNLAAYKAALGDTALPVAEGRLVEAVGLVLQAVGCRASVGDLYEVRPLLGGTPVEAEVVGLRGERTLLMALGEVAGLEIGSPLRRVGRAAYVGVGDGLIGRVFDGLGRPLDGKPMPALQTERPLRGVHRNPLNRRPVQTVFPVGVRAIDGLLTLGEGQRIGIFAGGGVGKSSLLGMMVKRAQADVCVVALVGERGREVEDFVNSTLGAEGLSRAVVIAATSADPPLVRVRASLLANAVAEHFRAQGQKVLLLMDSLTRYAMALREIGLAIGEPPATKGYTPTVFTELPHLVERAGTSAGPGSITGVYTVLVEGDDLSDPIADTVRACIDGHIVLSRELAERGHFPAIDVPRSISRVMPQLVDGDHMQLSQQARQVLATYREVEDLVAIGAYRKGSVPRLDEALALMPRLTGFLRQQMGEQTAPEQTMDALRGVWAPLAQAGGEA